MSKKKTVNASTTTDATEEILTAAPDDIGADEVSPDVVVTLTEAGEQATGGVIRLDESKAYDSPEALARYDAESVAEINAAELEVGIREAAWEDAHSHAARLKKLFEASTEDLRILIRERKEFRGKPPRPVQREITDPTTYPNDSDNPDWDKRPDDLPASPVDESWKKVPLSEMVEKDGLPAKVAEILSANGLDTLGKVTDFTNPTASGWCPTLCDFSGFGPKKLEQWQDACSRFWERQTNEQRKRTHVENSGPGDAGADGEPASVGGGGIPPDYVNEGDLPHEIPW